jgi:hypothetical protein
MEWEQNVAFSDSEIHFQLVDIIWNNFTISWHWSLQKQKIMDFQIDQTFFPRTSIKDTQRNNGHPRLHQRIFQLYECSYYVIHEIRSWFTYSIRWP